MVSYTYEYKLSDSQWETHVIQLLLCMMMSLMVSPYKKSLKWVQENRIVNWYNRLKFSTSEMLVHPNVLSLFLSQVKTTHSQWISLALECRLISLIMPQDQL